MRDYAIKYHQFKLPSSTVYSRKYTHGWVMNLKWFLKECGGHGHIAEGHDFFLEKYVHLTCN